MSLIEALSWPYGGGNPETLAWEFIRKLRDGIADGKPFPFLSNRHQIALITSPSGTWFVAIMVITNSDTDDSVKIMSQLDNWFKACGAGPYQDYESVSIHGATIESSLGSGYTTVATLDTSKNTLITIGSDRDAPTTASVSRPSPSSESKKLAETATVAQGQSTTPKPGSISPSAKPLPKKNRWAWPVLVMGGLLSLLGLCEVSVLFISGITPRTTGQTVGQYLAGITCLVLLPLIVGMCLLGFGIYTLRRRRNTSDNVPMQSFQETQTEAAPIPTAGIDQPAKPTSSSSKPKQVQGVSVLARLGKPDVNKIEDEGSGSTKLHLACSHGDLEQVRKLLAQGANVNITNKNGATPLDLAYSNGTGGSHHQVFVEIAGLLRSKGGKTNKWTGPIF